MKDTIRALWEQGKAREHNVTGHPDSLYLLIMRLVSSSIEVTDHHDVHRELIGYCKSIMCQLKKKGHGDILTCPGKALMELTGIVLDVFIKHPLGDGHRSKQTSQEEEDWWFLQRERLISHPGPAVWGAGCLFYLWLELSSLL